MKLCVLILLVCAAAGYSQNSAAASNAWRSRLLALPATPSTNTTPQDVMQFERNMRAAAAYLGTTMPDVTSAQWEQNKMMVRRMAAYLAGLRGLSGDIKLRSAVTHAQGSFDSLGFGSYLEYVMSTSNPDREAPGSESAASAADASPPPPSQMGPPFELDAPELVNVNPADKAKSAELTSRYETDSAYAAAVWQNAEILRQNLAARGMGLNLETATAMMRLPQQFHSAAADLRNSNWDSARSHLEQAEALTDKIAKTVGR